MRAYIIYRRDRKIPIPDAEWQAWYQLYLASPDWQTLRQQVMRRDNDTCQECRWARAHQVHHLTYDRAGREHLTDLIAICSSCHTQIHGHSPRPSA